MDELKKKIHDRNNGPHSAPASSPPSSPLSSSSSVDAIDELRKKIQQRTKNA